MKDALCNVCEQLVSMETRGHDHPGHWKSCFHSNGKLRENACEIQDANHIDQERIRIKLNIPLCDCGDCLNRRAGKEIIRVVRATNVPMIPDAKCVDTECGCRVN